MSTKSCRILSALLFIFCMIFCLPFSFAEDADEKCFGECFYVILDNNTVQITGCVANAEDLIIPDTIDGLPVVSIRDRAFYYNDFLQSVTIPDSVSSVGSNPFIKCNLLTSIIISPDHPYLLFMNDTLYDKVNKTIISHLSSSQSPLEIPKGITKIGEAAFNGCEAMSDISIPESVTSIADYAFCDCISLKNIEIPEQVNHIGEGAFSGCSSLKSVAIPESVTSIGPNPFEGCSSLKSLMVSPDHPVLAVIKNNLYNKTSKTLICYLEDPSQTSFSIPKGILEIGDSAFSSCKSLTNIIIPESVTSIGDRAFFSCSSLSTVQLPNTLTSIGEYAFTFCNSLTDISIPNSVMSIGNHAFWGCTSLSNITISMSITSLSSMIFSDCRSLVSITIPAGITSIGDYRLFNRIAFLSYFLY